MSRDNVPPDHKRLLSRLGSHHYQVRGGAYSSTHIPPLVLIGIARRLAPFVRGFTSMSVAFEAIGAADAKAGEEGGGAPISRAEALDRVIGGVSPVLDALAQMPEPDQNYIVEACLKVTSLKQPPNGLAVWNEGTGLIPTLSAGDVLGITAQVLNWELPALWNELQELGGMFQGIVGAAVSLKGAT